MNKQKNFTTQYWEIVETFLKSCTPLETMEYVVGHNYEMDADSLWSIAQNFDTEKGIVANIFWRLLPLYEGDLIHEEYFANEFYLIKFIIEHFHKYPDGKFGSKIDETYAKYISCVSKEFPNCPKELLEDMKGEIVNLALHTFEGLPQRVHNEIEAIRKQPIRRPLP